MNVKTAVQRNTGPILGGCAGTPGGAFRIITNWRNIPGTGRPTPEGFPTRAHNATRAHYWAKSASYSKNGPYFDANRRGGIIPRPERETAANRTTGAKTGEFSENLKFSKNYFWRFGISAGPFSNRGPGVYPLPLSAAALALRVPGFSFSPQKGAGRVGLPGSVH